MQAELRKIAVLLRAHTKTVEETKMVKCAQVVQAAIALELLRKKIGR